MKKRIAIIAAVAVIIAAAAICAAVFLLRGEAVKPVNATSLSLGEKYLAELDYARATVTLQKAIEAEPNNTEAYLALAKTYRYMGDIDMARQTLENGYDKTNSALIEREMRELSYSNTPATGGITAESVVLVEIAGKRYRSDITELVLRDCGLANDDLKKLREFKNLERLDISGNGISDISAVADVKTLKKFYAANNAITDVSPLSGLKSLEYVGLRGNRITDADPLLSHDNLIYLHLSENKITSVSKPGANLQLLYLADNEINDLSAVKNAGLLYCDTNGNPGT